MDNCCMGISGIRVTKCVESPAQMIQHLGTPAIVADFARSEESAYDSGLMRSTDFSDFQ